MAKTCGPRTNNPKKHGINKSKHSMNPGKK